MKFYINLIYFITLVIMSIIFCIGSLFGKIHLFISDGETWSISRKLASYIDNILEES